MGNWRERHWQERVEPRIFLLAQLRIATDVLALGTAGLNLVVGALGGAFVLTSSFVVGRIPAAMDAGVDSPQWRSLVTAFLVASGVVLAQQILTPLSAALGQLVKHRVDGLFYDRLLEASLRSASIAPQEDDESLANLRLAAEGLEKGSRTPGDAAAGTLALVTRYSRLCAFVLIIGVVISWWAAAAIGLVTMTLRVGHRDVVRTYTRLVPVMNPLRRESDYFLGLGVGPVAAKETRVFGLTSWIIERYRSSALAAIRPLWRERRRVNVTAFLWRSVFSLIVVCLVVALMLRAGAAGTLTLTQLTVGVQATIAAVLLGEFYHESDTGTQFGLIAVRALERFRSQVAASDAGLPSANSGASTEKAFPSFSEVRFSNVTFSYGSGGRPVLDGLDLTLRAGECTALVGLNGSGKTTLVKLLARLYEPTQGAILVDGRDIATLPVDVWRRQIGVVFQDFIRYELSLSDNIAFGAIEHRYDPGQLAAMAARAGLADIVAGLPRGLDTVLASQYDGGVELSGGQWQRLAIARALLAVDAGARILVLDEPTAALDVRAEAAFFDEFAERTRGRTTLLISHRFSSVRHADRIVVLSGGRLIEDGTHESLLARDGRYAELYRLQASLFAADAQGWEDDAVDSASPKTEVRR